MICHCPFRCRRLAASGYVTASIDYRLLWTKLGHPRDILVAMADARAAVRWLRRNEFNGTSLRVDPSRIAAFGSSAGGMTVVYMATVADNNTHDNATNPYTNPDNPGYSSAIQAAVSLSGARFPPPAGLGDMSGRDPPYVDFHGCDDPLVPYDCSDGCTCEGKRLDCIA